LLKPRLIAEIGCNHQGNLEKALRMIDAAVAFGRADYVKFQKREISEAALRDERPHPNPVHSFGSTYALHRKFLEFSFEEHALLRDHCAKLGARYACSVWDIPSAKGIISLGPDYIKIPSALNLNFSLLSYVYEMFPGSVHLSLGMTTAAELASILAFLKAGKVLPRTVFYACISAYPTQPKDACLLEVERLRGLFPNERSSVGFSGHHEGTALDIAAFTLGATWIERHFTLDRSWKGTDHAFSLEPQNFQKLRDDLDAVAAAMTHKGASVLPAERSAREKLKGFVQEHVEEPVLSLHPGISG
jgi:N-acetylneuraminate synthase